VGFNLELSQTKALVAIGELSSFQKAGERLNLSPPAVFAELRKLEQELGEKLYQRVGRKLVLTPAGRLLKDYCQRLLLIHDEAVGAVQELSGVQRGSLYLGCGPHISVSIVPHMLRAYLAHYPNVELRLITGSDHMLFSDLDAGKVDLIMMNLPVNRPDLVQDPLWRYEMVFVLPPNGPLEDCSDPIIASAEELSKRPFILYQRAVVIEAAIRQFCVAVGFEPKVVMQNDQADSIKELVKLGLGISLLPLWSVSEDVRRGTLRIARLATRQLSSTTGLIYRKTPHMPRALAAFFKVAHQWKSWLPQAEAVVPVKSQPGSMS
jgi:DNA-binding transcriptional LysR family regulator